MRRLDAATYFAGDQTRGICPRQARPHDRTLLKPNHGADGQVGSVLCIRVLKINNFCIVFEQTSEAVYVINFSELHARSDLRFIIRLQEIVLIVPASS